MSLLERRRRAANAERHLQLAQAGWRARAASLRKRVEQHRVAYAIGGGFAGGVIAGLLPLRGIVRLGSVAASLVATTLRTPLGTLLLESLRKPANRKEGAE